MNPIFKPKDRDEVLLDIAKGRYANRALLIGVSEKHPELFDRFFNALMKVPTFELEATIKSLKKGYVTSVNLKDSNDAAKYIYLFKSLGFDVSKFKIEELKYGMYIKIDIDDLKLIRHYDSLADEYQPHKKKRKKRLAKKPLGF
jgi:hypothetical protein